MGVLKLIIFVKAPRPGQVKTRLASTLGAEAACRAYQRMVQGVVTALASIESVELRFTPEDAAAEIQPWLRPGWTAQPQGEGDLGQRMHAAFLEAFAAGATRVALVGSDCPELTSGDIRRAWRSLDAHDLVLGPSADGGYWLIGLRQPQPTLFEGVTWGSDQVLAQTLQRARQAGLKLDLLRILADLDTETEWRRWLGQDDPDC